MALNPQPFLWLLLSSGFLKGEAARHVWSLFSFTKVSRLLSGESTTSAASAFELSSALLVAEASARGLLWHANSPAPNTLPAGVSASWKKPLRLADGDTCPEMKELCRPKLSLRLPKLRCQCLPQLLTSETVWECVWLRPRRKKNQYTF